MRKVVTCDSAPTPIGPFSSAIAANGFVFASGQIALDPNADRLVDGDAAAQTDRCLANVVAVPEAAGSRLDKVVRCVVYLRSNDDFAIMNAIYSRFFLSDPPARTTIAAAGPPRNAFFEIEATAIV